MSPEFQSSLEKLCCSHQEFLAQHAGEILVRSRTLLYGQTEIEERNLTHEVALFLPGYVAIGNDGGDYEYLLRCNGSETVYREDPGAFSAPSLEAIHVSFPRWLAEGCPLPEAPEMPIPLHGQIWLLCEPPGGIKDLFRINKFLGLDWSIPKLKQSLTSLPAELISRGAPFRVHRGLASHPDLRPWLGFSRPGETIRPFADFSDHDGIAPRR